MKSATKRLKSQKHASWTKSQNGSGEIAVISPSVNSNIWRRYFPANSIWHATSARYWREAWKWLNFRSETGFKTSDTKKSIALTRTLNKLNQILQCPWKGKGNSIPPPSKRLAKMKATAILGTVDDSYTRGTQFIWGIFRQYQQCIQIEFFYLSKSLILWKILLASRSRNCIWNRIHLRTANYKL